MPLPRLSKVQTPKNPEVGQAVRYRKRARKMSDVKQKAFQAMFGSVPKQPPPKWHAGPKWPRRLGPRIPGRRHNL